MKGQEMARTLGQVAGVMMPIRQKDGDVGKDLQKRIQSEALTTGLKKIYTPVQDPDEEGARGVLTVRQPNSFKPVALTVQAALEEVVKYAIPALDITAKNQIVADAVLDSHKKRTWIDTPLAPMLR